MIVCKQCGHHNEDNDTFCGSCGKFLEWTGERVVVAEPEPEPPPPPAPEPQPTHLGLIDRVKQAVGIDDAAQPAPPSPAVASGASASTASAAAPTAPTPGAASTLAAPAAAPPPASAPASPPPQPAPVYRPVPVTSMAPPPPAPIAAPAPPPPAAPTYPSAARPVYPAAPVSAPEPVLAGVGAPAAATPAAPVAPPSDEPMSRRPSSVAPAVARPRTAPRTVEAPTRRRPGDLICGQCGEGNDPTRHFCRRCGSSLDEAISVRLPWYRRLFNRLFGVRTREAGWRPRRVGAPNVLGPIMRTIRLAIVAVIVLALLAFLLVPSFHTLVVDRVTAAVTAIRKLVHPNYDPIYATGTSASSSIAGHLPPLADDRVKGTYWAALPTDHTPTLTFKFDGPHDIAEIGFTSGASGTAPQEQFLAQPRPQRVHLIFSNGTTVTSQDLTLSDTDAAQFKAINAKGVTVVEIQVVSVYTPGGATPSSVAIDEVEFRIKD